MSRTSWFWLALTLLACKPGSPAPDDESGHEPAHEPAAAASTGAGAVFRVEPSMLRDLRITVRPAEARTAGDTVSVLGELGVNEEAYAEIGTAITARVAKVLVSPGDQVRAGQPLVELDSPEVGKTRAALSMARTRHQLAQQTLTRKSDLARDQIVPERELQAAQASLDEAAAEERSAQQALAALGASSGWGARFTLTSPIAGTVIDRTALLGRLVDAERPLFVVGDLSRLWLISHAFERDALRMQVGATARVGFPALPGESLSAVVTRLGSRVDPTSRTVDVRLELDNPAGKLKPGMSATALVPVGDAGQVVVAVPVVAVQRQPSGWCVFLPGKQPGEFELRPVARGRDLGDEVEILSGLTAGQAVVVDGAFLLKTEADKARDGQAEHHH